MNFLIFKDLSIAILVCLTVEYFKLKVNLHSEVYVSNKKNNRMLKSFWNNIYRAFSNSINNFRRVIKVKKLQHNIGSQIINFTSNTACFVLWIRIVDYNTEKIKNLKLKKQRHVPYFVKKYDNTKKRSEKTCYSIYRWNRTNLKSQFKM